MVEVGGCCESLSLVEEVWEGRWMDGWRTERRRGGKRIWPT